MLNRYANIYAALWKNSVTREMTFKSNFLLWIFVELLWFGLQLCFIGVLYLHTDHIGTWTKWQVVMLIGASHFIQQIFQAFFLVNCTNLSELIRTGKMDFLLVLPVNTRFVVSLRQVDLGGFVNAGSAVAVMVYAARQLRLVPGFSQVLGFLVLCGTGILIPPGASYYAGRSVPRTNQFTSTEFGSSQAPYQAREGAAAEGCRHDPAGIAADGRIRLWADRPQLLLRTGA